MTHEIHPILRHLFHDHSNMLRILNALQREVDRLRTSGTSDHQRLKWIIEYLLTYADVRHHPREDRIFQRLALCNPVAAGEAEALMAEHKDLAEAAQRLSAAFYRLQHDAGAPHEEFGALAMSFIDRMQAHIHSEETNYFPAAVRSLKTEDWSMLEGEQPGKVTLGDQIDQEFQALHDRIIRS